MVGRKRIWLYDWRDHPKLCLRRPVPHGSSDATHMGQNNWERQSFAELHGSRAADFPTLREATRWVADIAPGELLYIPANWLHEVHTREPSFSLGWRFEIAPHELTAPQRTAVDECAADHGRAHPQHARGTLWAGVGTCAARRWARERR